MDPAQGVGVAAFLALGAAFAFAGARLRAFLRLAAGIVVLSVITSALWIDGAGGRGSLPLVLAAVVLFAVGLAILRLMILRSVTLHFLSRLQQTEAAATMQGEIDGRLVELERMGLARRAGDRLQATRRGRLVGTLAGGLYRVFRIPG